MDLLVEMRKHLNYIRNERNGVFKFAATDVILTKEQVEELKDLLLQGKVIPRPMQALILYIPIEKTEINIKQDDVN